MEEENQPFHAKLVGMPQRPIARSRSLSMPDERQIAVGTRRLTSPAPKGATKAADVPVAQCGRDGMYGFSRMLEAITGNPASAAIDQLAVADSPLVKQALERTWTGAEQPCDIIDVRITPR